MLGTFGAQPRAMRTIPLLVIGVTVLGCSTESSDPDKGSDGKADGSAEQCAAPTWNIEVIASGNVGRYTTYRIDRAGDEHVLYRDDAAKRMVYATRAAGASTWQKSPVPCTDVVEDVWVYAPHGHSANANLAVTDDGTAYVMCARPAQAADNSSGAVFERAAGATQWTQRDLPAVFTDLSAYSYQHSIGSSIAVAPDGTVNLVTHVRRSEPTHPETYDWSKVTVWTKAPAGFTKRFETDYAASEHTGWGGTTLALCVGADAAHISGPALGYGGTTSMFTEMTLPAGATPTTTTMIAYDVGSFVNASGYEPACDVDTQGRAFHAAYDRSTQYVSLVRKGAGAPVLKFQDSGMWPDVKTRGSSVFMSFNVEDTLKLYSLVGATEKVTDVDIDGVGQYTSMAIDDAGLPRIAYYDQSEARLKLATLGCP